MTPERFVELIANLTGTPVKEAETSKPIIEAILSDETKRLDCSQFNELLLLVNKDRIEQPFFNAFFSDEPTVGGIEAAIERFQKMAMLCFGNFIYAYRKLSKIKNDDKFKAEVGDFSKSARDIEKEFRARSNRLTDIKKIEKKDTHLIGYISARTIIADYKRLEKLHSYVAKVLPQNNHEEVITQLKSNLTDAEEQKFYETYIRSYFARLPQSTLNDLQTYLSPELEDAQKRYNLLNEIRNQATLNQDIYLTWDHMDIYFATSMRKKSEFEEVFDFIDKMMNTVKLRRLNLRYFDPTQCYTADRINKGLVESLMLKRAKCTVYCVQDTDTLGKDSELAATLAQGKPVIAFIPETNCAQRVEELKAMSILSLQERFRFVAHLEESVLPKSSADAQTFFCQKLDATTLSPNGETIKEIATIVSNAEQRLYDKRAETLQRAHPLGIQVNLASGVANGVLVTRKTDECAELLYRILTNQMEFILRDVKEDSDRGIAGMWKLEEKISGCVYRVVTKDRKLTNCFWNFYK